MLHSKPTRIELTAEDVEVYDREKARKRAEAQKLEQEKDKGKAPIGDSGPSFTPVKPHDVRYRLGVGANPK